MTKLCPSAQPGMENCTVLGVVQQEGPAPTLVYLNQKVPATPEVLALAAPLKPAGGFSSCRDVRGEENARTLTEPIASWRRA